MFPVWGRYKEGDQILSGSADQLLLFPHVGEDTGGFESQIWDRLVVTSVTLVLGVLLIGPGSLDSCSRSKNSTGQ